MRRIRECKRKRNRTNKCKLKLKCKPKRKHKLMPQPICLSLSIGANMDARLSSKPEPKSKDDPKPNPEPESNPDSLIFHGDKTHQRDFPMHGLAVQSQGDDMARVTDRVRVRARMEVRPGLRVGVEVRVGVRVRVQVGLGVRVRVRVGVRVGGYVSIASISGCRLESGMPETRSTRLGREAFWKVSFRRTCASYSLVRMTVTSPCRPRVTYMTLSSLRRRSQASVTLVCADSRSPPHCSIRPCIG